jgi:hypothetical protein
MAGATINPLGQGLSFPPRVGPDGRLALSVGEDNVRESMRIILTTEPTERLMREEFGCGLRAFLLAPNTATTRESIRESVMLAIARWEPRVSVDDVTVDPDAQEARQVNVTVLFRLVATQGAGRIGFSLALQG